MASSARGGQVHARAPECKVPVGPLQCLRGSSWRDTLLENARKLRACKMRANSEHAQLWRQRASQVPPSHVFNVKRTSSSYSSSRAPPCAHDTAPGYHYVPQPVDSCPQAADLLARPSHTNLCRGLHGSSVPIPCACAQVCAPDVTRRAVQPARAPVDCAAVVLCAPPGRLHDWTQQRAWRQTPATSARAAYPCSSGVVALRFSSAFFSFPRSKISKIISCEASPTRKVES